MISAEELEEYLNGVPENIKFNSNDIFKMLKREHSGYFYIIINFIICLSYTENRCRLFE